MSIIGNIFNKVEHAVDTFTQPLQELAHTKGLDAIGNKSANTDLVASKAVSLPGLDGIKSNVASRASFPSNPLSLDNFKNIGKLLLGTVPLTKYLLPDFVEDGKIETFPSSQAKSSDPKVYLVNGIATNDGGRDTMGKDTASATGKNVTFVNNSTDGPAVDLLQCVSELVFAQPTKPTTTLSNEIYKNLTSQPPQKMELIGYSQGTIITTHAISMAITRMKENGYSDDQIKGLMSNNVKVALAGCPVDLNNPAHTITNVPPGPAGPDTKRLDYYFTTEDRQIFGAGEPYTEKINRESGAGELSKPNFEILRHDKDLVATTIHDIKLKDLGDIVKDPAGLFQRIGSQLIDDLGSSFKDTLNPVGYHMYNNVYLDFMASRNLI